MCAEPYDLGPEPAPPPPLRGLEGADPGKDVAAEKERLEEPFRVEAGGTGQASGTSNVNEEGQDFSAPAEEPDASDAAEGKLPAVLAYALCIIHVPALSALALPFPIPGLPYFALILLMRQNRFALYHAKQAAVLWLLMLVGTILTHFTVTMLIGYALDWGAIALAVVGLVRVARGWAIPLPVVGRVAEKLLGGVSIHEDQ